MSDELEVVDLEDFIEAPTPVVIKASPAVSPVVKGRLSSPDSMSVIEVMPLLEAAERYFGSDIAVLSPLQQLVVIAYLKSGNASKACAMAGATIKQHQMWLSEEAYVGIFRAAEEAITDQIEEAGIRGAIQDRDPRLIGLMLKGRRREKYGQQKTEDVKTANSWSDLARTLSDEKE